MLSLFTFLKIFYALQRISDSVDPISSIKTTGDAVYSKIGDNNTYIRELSSSLVTTIEGLDKLNDKVDIISSNAINKKLVVSSPELVPAKLSVSPKLLLKY